MNRSYLKLNDTLLFLLIRVDKYEGPAYNKVIEKDKRNEKDR